MIGLLLLTVLVGLVTADSLDCDGCMKRDYTTYNTWCRDCSDCITPGDVTYYYNTTNLMAFSCEETPNNAPRNYAAISFSYFNPNENGEKGENNACGTDVTISNGQDTFEVVIMDPCLACQCDDKIDVSKELYDDIMKTKVDGEPIKWWPTKFPDNVHTLDNYKDNTGQALSNTLKQNTPSNVQTPVDNTKKTTYIKDKAGTKPNKSYTTSCSWQGHCRGAKCINYDDCSDQLICIDGICGIK